MKSKAWQHHASIILLILSVGINVVLVKRLHALTHVDTGLQSGERVHALDVTSLDGRPVRIAFTGDLPTVLYYFSPTCAWCERNWDNVRALAAGAPGRYQLIGLSTSAEIGEFMQKRGLAFDVYSGVSDEAVRTYHLNGTPQTVVVSGKGTVIRAWPGAYTPDATREIERQFGLSLPGIRAAAHQP